MPYDAGGFYNNSPAPFPVPTAMPWGSSAAGVFSTQDPGGLAANYARSYQDSLSMNQSLYQNMMAGYQGALQQQMGAQSKIGANYDNLKNEVMGKVGGIGKAGEQAIVDRYTADLGKQSQSLIDRGLGNTTVQSAVSRGLGYDRDKSIVANNEWVANLQAQYLANIGKDAINAQQQAYGANTALLGDQLRTMNSMQIAYPDAGLYAQLAGQYGDRGDRNKGGYGSGAPMGGGGGAPGLGYMPRPAPMYPDGGGQLGMPGGGGGGSSWLMQQYGAPSWGTGAGTPYSSPFEGASGGGFSYLPANQGNYVPLEMGYGAGDYGGGGDF